MKKLLQIAVLTLLIQNSFAQSYQWIKSGGGDMTNPFYDLKEYTKKIEIDNDGNTFIISNVGNFANAASTLLIDGVPKSIPGTYSNTDVSHGLIASFDCNGTYRWSKIITGQTHSNIQDVKLDSQGNVYFIGNLDPADFYTANRFENDYVFPLMYNGPSPAYLNYNLYSAYIAKYTNTGTFVWVKTLEPQVRRTQDGGGKPVFMRALEIDSQDNPLVIAEIKKSPLVISGAYVNSFGTTDQISVHLLKYNSNGQFVEGKRMEVIDEAHYVTNQWIRNKQTGNFYMTGIRDSANYPTILGSQTLGNGIYLACFDQNGVFQWVVEDEKSFTNNMSSLALDANGDIYFSNGMIAGGGTFNAPAAYVNSFAGFSFTQDPTAIGAFEPFVVKLTASGQPIWGTAATRNGSIDPLGIAVNGNEVAIGHRFDQLTWDGQATTTTSNLVTGANQKKRPGIVRFNKTTGAMIAMDRVPISPNADYTDQVKVIKADNLGNYYLGGALTTSITVNGTTVDNNGGDTDLFLMKYGTSNCNCQVPTCKFKATKTSVGSSVVNFQYQGQNVYTSVSWNFGDGTPTSNLVNPSHTYATAGTYNVCLTATNACDSYTYCNNINTTTLLSSTYIGEANDRTISIFPNPAEDQATIKFQSQFDNAKIELYDLTGRLVDSFSTNDTTGVWSINLTNLTSGVYMVVMKEDGKIALQQKLVKK